MRRNHELGTRTCRILFTGLMVIAWTGGTRLTAQPAPPDRKQAAETVERLLQLLEAADREGPRATFDVQAVVREVGRDPVRLFDWVRDNTHWVPYEGALRGPAGVLMDRVGNSLDRSLLLAELLRTAGQKVQLVRAKLDDAQAKDLLSKVRPLPKDWLASVGEEPDEKAAEQLDKYAGRFGIEPSRLRAAAGKASVAAQRAAEEVAGRVAEQAGAVAAAVLGGDKAGGARDAGANEPDAVAAARDHWWVRRDDGGTWVDLDPTLPDARPGAPATKADGQAVAYEGNIPAEAPSHTVQVRVTIERWEAGALREEPVLTQEYRPADVLGKRLTLSHIPANWPSDIDLTNRDDGGRALKEAAAQQQEWVPVLQAGRDTVLKAGFDNAGHVIADPKLAPMKKVGAAAGNAARDALDVLEPAPPAPAAATHLTAEWIDYEIRSPGRPPLRVRRQLFDLVGPAARAAGAVPSPAMDDTTVVARALALLGESELLLQPCHVSRDFVNHLAVQGVLANRKLLRELATNPPTEAKAAADVFDRMVLPPGPVYQLALARRLYSPVAGETYLDRPNVLSYHRQFRLDDAGRVLVYEGFDIVANAVALAGTDGAGLAQAAAVRVRQGVADTAAEAALLDARARRDNASDLFAASQASGDQWVTLRGRDDPALATLGLPDDVRMRIGQDLAAGYVVVAPKRSAGADGTAAAAWWRVDPSTGQTLGIGPQGWGAVTTEQAIIYVRVLVKAALFYKCVGSATGAGGVALCAGIMIAGAAGIAAGGAAGGALSLLADFFSAVK